MSSTMKKLVKLVSNQLSFAPVSVSYPGLWRWSRRAYQGAYTFSYQQRPLSSSPCAPTVARAASSHQHEKAIRHIFAPVFSRAMHASRYIVTTGQIPPCHGGSVSRICHDMKPRARVHLLLPPSLSSHLLLLPSLSSSFGNSLT